MSHPKKPTDMGTNRTGIKASPFDGRDLAKASDASVPNPTFDPIALRRMHEERAQEAPPIGSMPPPANLKGVANAIAQKLKGDKANVLIDKLGERLAFERSGTRLYEALLVKLSAADPHDTGITRAQVEEIRDDELRHFGILHAAMEGIGADPTAMTTSADVVGVASMGLVAVVTDSRTTLSEALEAILVAELTDVDGWELLIHLADGFGMTEMADSFRTCLAEEATHLTRVRTWLQRSVSGQAGVSPPRGAPRAGAVQPSAK